MFLLLIWIEMIGRFTLNIILNHTDQEVHFSIHPISKGGSDRERAKHESKFRRPSPAAKLIMEDMPNHSRGASRAKTTNGNGHSNPLEGGDSNLREPLLSSNP